MGSANAPFLVSMKSSYLCDTRGCTSNRKSVPRAKIENGFSEILRALQPQKQLFALVREMFNDAWNMRLIEAKNDKAALKRQIADLDKQIQGLLDRIMDATSPSVIGAYEARIDKLEREKILLTERVDQIMPPKGRREESIEPVLEFLSKPWNLYENGSLLLKRTVLRLTFSEPLRYSRERGYRTAKITFPFKVLADFCNQKCEMVEPRGVEPLTSCMPCKRSPN